MKTYILIMLFFLKFSYPTNNSIQNDTLKKLSFEDIRLKLVDNIENKNSFKFYVDYYIKKAKRENNVEYLIKGYGFKVEEYPFNEAIKNADSMYSIITNKAPNLLFLYYFKLGNLYASNRKNKKALDSYLKAYKNCKGCEEKYYYAIKRQIGIIRSTLGQDKEAINILKETENYFKTKSVENYLFLQYNMAEIYNSLLDLETARYIIDEGIILSKREGSKLMYDRFITTKGVNLYYRKEYKETLELLLPILQDANFVKEDYSDFAFVSYYIGKSYQELNDKDLALKYFKKVDSIFTKHNDVYYWNIDTYKFLIDYYKEKKEIKKQLIYTERLIKVDSLLLKNNEYTFKKTNKEFDIPNLIFEKENLIKKLRKYDSLSKITNLISIIIISLLIYLFYRNKKNNKQKIELIKNDLEKFLLNQHKIFEYKNKNSTGDFINNYEKNNESQGKMSDLAKENILKNLDLFEKNKDYINKNCSLENLAKDFNTNKTYLSKIINEDKGYSFSSYINNLRIDYVIQLLKEDKKIRKYSIESIAEEVGYNNAKAFSKAFYERIQVKPSVFIKNME
ncbi:helix-turn-helix transcriptional regulator [Flavobacterium sp. J27]|uniref:helix-turn-helix transcriptional regulator n=1 Tax=Flavobacterium sp. J27 TaxID=2060419 RepID=UPI001030AC57|nr:helix-turn-helix transcriptional regulator [Flavobacterium sp. J27]